MTFMASKYFFFASVFYGAAFAAVHNLVKILGQGTDIT